MSSNKEDQTKQEDHQSKPEWEGRLDKVLHDAKHDLLLELVEAHNIKMAKSAKKDKLVEAIMAESVKLGEKEFLEKLDKEEMKDALAAFGVKIEGDNKSKIKAEFKKEFTDKGQEAFFKKCDSATLNKFCERIGFKEEGGKGEVEDALAEEILTIGAKKMFEGLRKEFATDVAKSLGIKVTGSKEVVINRIIGQAFHHLLEAEEEKKSPGEKKKKVDPNRKPIDQCEHVEDLYQYYQSELTDFCKENNIRKAGSKKDIIRRILKFNKGEKEEPLKAGERTKKKKGRKLDEEEKKAREEKEAKLMEKIKQMKRKRLEEFAATVEGKKARK